METFAGLNSTMPMKIGRSNWLMGDGGGKVLDKRPSQPSGPSNGKLQVVL